MCGEQGSTQHHKKLNITDNIGDSRPPTIAVARSPFSTFACLKIRVLK